MYSSSTLLAGRAAAQDVIARAAAVIAVPKQAPANSFVLHAPLELMGRVGLLAYLPADRIDDALYRVEWLAAQYAAAGDPVETPRVPLPADPSLAALGLVPALRDGDLDAVDAIATAILPSTSAFEAIGLLGEPIVTSLAAAGHAPIGLFLLRRLWPVLPADLLRGALRSVAMQPDWQVRWHDEEGHDGDAAGLYAAIRATPHLGVPGSDFIYPLMSQVQDAGVAAQLLGPLLTDRYDIVAAARTFTRVANWSMAYDDPSVAAYGWSHLLTMPQAVMALAGGGVHPRTALAVAGTFAVGMRAAHGTVELPEHLTAGVDPDVDLAELALSAALHDDAHLVKHTLACLYAAQDDPAFASLALRSAAHLVDHWSAWRTI